MTLAHLDVARGIDHLTKTAGIVLDQHVRQQQCKRLAPDQLARTPHRVTQTERQLLPREARRAGARQVARQGIELDLALTLGERVLELELAVEMVLDHALVATSDEDEVLDAGLARLVDHVLDQRSVDHRQHLLRHGLGRRKEPGAQAGDRKYRFANGFHDHGIVRRTSAPRIGLAIAEVWTCV